jgi:hypothetical protein
MASAKGSNQVVLEGKGLVTLRPTDHLATGGEGSIYRISDSVVKIYLDPAKMRQQGIPDKLKLLAGLKHPYVVAPQGLALSPKGDPVGYYMPYAEGHPLSRVFTNDFWQKEGFTFRHTSTLVDRMRHVFSFAHQHQAVLVDANEMNWLATLAGKDPEPRIVDVDSWSIGRWPAKVIMPSIRDWNSKTFDERSDWFAWAIVTFQIYTGIHPYKGTLDGFDRGNLEGRMKSNASVFTPGVRLNRAVRDFSHIPSPLLNWYEATFQNGERNQPPSPFDTGVTAPRAAQVMRMVTTSKTGMLVFEKIVSRASDPLVNVFHCGIALCASGSLIDCSTKRQIGTVRSRACEVIRTDTGWLIADWDAGHAVFSSVEEGSLKTEKLMLTIQGQRFVRYENRLFLVTEKGLTEIKVHMFGKAVASVGNTWGVMTTSTKWFDGMGVQDAMGAKFVVVPFGENSAVQQRIRELDGLQVVAGKAGNRFVSMIALDRTGTYRTIEILFNQEYTSYKISESKADSPEMNVAILPKGVCATILQDGQLVIFVPTNGQTHLIDDGQIATDMLLSNWGDRVVYVHKGDLWSLKMK